MNYEQLVKLAEEYKLPSFTPKDLGIDTTRSATEADKILKGLDTYIPDTNDEVLELLPDPSLSSHLPPFEEALAPFLAKNPMPTPTPTPAPAAVPPPKDWVPHLWALFGK